MTEEQTTETAADLRSAGCFCLGMGPELSSILRKLGPPEEVQEHFRNARVEILKGIRSMIDSRIEHLQRHKQKGTAIKVE